MKDEYRILEKMVDGEPLFYPQRRFWGVFWRTVRRETFLPWSIEDGRWRSKYSAELFIAKHKESIKRGIIYHRPEGIG